VWQPNPAFDQWVERHAIELCADAPEGHTDARPCFEHLHQARRLGRSWAANPDVVTS
jgi:hypothetical protein